MSFRRTATLALATAALVSGCKNVSQEPSPQELVVAAFNSPICVGTPLQCPSLVPTPNDLALQAAPTLPAGAQKALLQAFVVAGGFPSDQTVGVTIPLKQLRFDAVSGGYALVTPPLVDRNTLVSGSTFVVVRIDQANAASESVEVDVENCTTGQIALRKAKNAAGSRAWAPGRYAFAISTGVRTTTGLAVSADQGIALSIPNKDLTNPNNQPPGGLPPALAAQVDSVRKSLWNPVDWNNAGGFWTANAPGVVAAFTAVGRFIPADQVASIGTFEIAPASPTPPVDAASGIAPLPLDLLRTANSGTTIAFNSAFGPAALGLTTLDGFSTTAMVFAPVTVPVDAGTVNGATVHLFKVNGASVTLLKEFRQELGKVAQADPTADPFGAAYVAEPTPITTTLGNQVAAGVPCAAATCSLIVGLQPAAGADVPLPLQGVLGTNKIYLPPLDEATDYAVVITTAVKDMLGRRLVKSTVAKILTDPGFDPIATSSVNGKSLLAGISDETATALQKMREQLVPVLANLPSGETTANVALAYTFRTQSSIAATGQLNALALAGLPYTKAVGVAVDPQAITTFTPAVIAGSYGIDPAILTTASGAIAEFAEVKVETVSWLLNSQNQGAFDPFHPTTEVVTALVAVPDLSRVGTCGGLPCAPLVVFEHGLGSSKAEVLPIAASLADKGFIVAAIDLPLHGERSYCSGSGATAQATANAMCCPVTLCPTEPSTCAFKANLTSSVDADAGGVIQIGVCEKAPGVRGRMLNHRWDSATTPSPKGVAFASANRLISLNFFRVRDSLRQDVIDVSALVKALAPISAPANTAFIAYLAGSHGGLQVDPTHVYWIGHSGGVFAGTASLAANPRITRAVTYAGGATAIDVFANPESHFNASLLQLLGQAGIQPGTPDFLKFLQIGKWILDPADPANFARYVVPAGPGLPNQLLGGLQPPRQVLTQLSLCDGTVPNTQNTLLSGLIGRTPTGAPLVDATFGDWRVPPPGTITSARTQWFSKTGAAACPGDAVGHSNPWDFANASLAWKAQAQMAGFLASPANGVTPVTE